MSDNFIGVRPNLNDWAEAIYNGTINGANKKRTIRWLEEELKDIANKYYLMGFEDGDKDGWWTEQDTCKHIGNPPKNKFPTINELVKEGKKIHLANAKKVLDYYQTILKIVFPEGLSIRNKE